MVCFRPSNHKYWCDISPVNEIPQMKVAFISTFLWQVGVVLRVTKMRAVCKQSRSRHCIKKPTEKKLISERAKQKKYNQTEWNKNCTHNRTEEANNKITMYARMHSSHNITPQSMIFLNLLAHYSFDIAFISCSLIIASKSLTYKSHSNKINFLVIAVTVWYVVALWRVVTFSFVFRVIIRSSCLFLCVDLFLSGWLAGWLAGWLTGLCQYQCQCSLSFAVFSICQIKTNVVVNVYLFYLDSFALFPFFQIGLFSNDSE